jgi:hypothetical protein
MTGLVRAWVQLKLCLNLSFRVSKIETSAAGRRKKRLNKDPHHYTTLNLIGEGSQNVALFSEASNE